MSHIRFNDDDSEQDEYVPSDSEDDLDEDQLKLLKSAQKSNRNNDDSEEEVFGVDSDDDDNSHGSDLAISDIDGNDDDNLPDQRAWGKDKRRYHGTDYVDPDYEGYNEKDEAAAVIEEEEAKILQKKLAEQLDDDDFNLEFFAKKTEDDNKTTEESIQTDLSKLSKRQKLQILQKESPELFGLLDDFKEKMTLIKDYLAPIITQHKEGKISTSDAMDFVNEYYHLILNYCMNIYMYLLLKSSQQKVQNHPVVKRLYQYRQLLLQMTPVFEEVVKPQIKDLINSINKTSISPVKDKSKKRNKTENTDLKEKKKKIKSQKESENEEEVVKQTLSNKKLKPKEKNQNPLVNADQHKKEKKKKQVQLSSDDNSDYDEIVDLENKLVADNDDEDGRRAITYQMAKNKGLMPTRKKEQRNPRVKHRNKYRKAKIRRKGAVREVRKELSRYGGEMSGIKATVSKSIKIKS